MYTCTSRVPLATLRPGRPVRPTRYVHAVDLVHVSAGTICDTRCASSAAVETCLRLQARTCLRGGVPGAHAEACLGALEMSQTSWDRSCWAALPCTVHADAAARSHCMAAIASPNPRRCGAPAAVNVYVCTRPRSGMRADACASQSARLLRESFGVEYVLDTKRRWQLTRACYICKMPSCGARHGSICGGRSLAYMRMHSCPRDRSPRIHLRDTATRLRPGWSSTRARPCPQDGARVELSLAVLS